MFGFMLKYSFLFACFLFALIGCQNNSIQKLSIEDINHLQKTIDSIAPDSAILKLKTINIVLKDNASFPDSLRAHNNYLIGTYFKKRSEMDSAAIYFHHATDFVKDSVSKNIESVYFYSAWDAYSSLELYGNCFTITKKYKSILNNEKKFRSLSWALFWEQTTHVKMGQYDKAFDIVQERVEIAKSKDPKSLPSALAGQADFMYNYLGDKKGAIQILEELIAEPENLAFSDKRQIYNNYGVYMYYDGDFLKALSYYKLGLASAKLENNPNKTNSIANCYNNIAEVNLDLKRYKDASIYLDSVKQLGVANLAKDKQKSLLNYELRLAIESSKSSANTTKILDEIYNHQDEIYKLQSKNELIALTKTNERQKVLLQEKQADQIEKLKLQTRSIILFVSLILLSVVGLLFYGRRKLKFEKESLQMQQRLFRSQMNPHFTYNTLYAIQNEIKKDQKSAEQYLVKFSRLLRLILENSMSSYVLLEKELEAIKKYMDLQLMRMPGKFTYTLELSNMEEDEMVFIPPMLLQPIVENSIEHGFKEIDYLGNITIKMALEDKFIHCSIEDNGVGFSKFDSNHKQSASSSLISDFLVKSTKQRFKVIEKNQENYNETGLITQFLIPYKLTEYD